MDYQIYRNDQENIARRAPYIFEGGIIDADESGLIDLIQAD